MQTNKPADRRRADRQADRLATDAQTRQAGKQAEVGQRAPACCTPFSARPMPNANHPYVSRCAPCVRCRMARNAK
eukprot:2632503-Lingulodinium_polyedra.AAC.1